MEDKITFREEILFPELKICDSHQHFFDQPMSYMPEDLMADIGKGHRIEKTVFVDCHFRYRKDGPEELQCVGETEHVEQIADFFQSDGIRVAAGIVAFADLTLGDRVQPVIEAHLAASKKVKSIRNVAAWDASDAFAKGYNAPREGILLEKSFRNGFAKLKKYGLVFDCMLFHTQLNDVVNLAEVFPDTVIVLNHTGVPLGIGPYEGKRESVQSLWKEQIRNLSKYENVYIKLSGVGQQVAAYGVKQLKAPRSSEKVAELYRPYALWCIDHFGVNRCMFGSNFPVDSILLDYGVVWNVFKRITADFSSGERDALFRKTAENVYNL